jgi:hypothetical protein
MDQLIICLEETPVAAFILRNTRKLQPRSVGKIQRILIMQPTEHVVTTGALKGAQRHELVGYLT